MRLLSKRFFAWFSLIFLAFSGISFNFKNLIFLCAFCILLAIFWAILRKKSKKTQNLNVIAIGLLFAALLGAFASCGLVWVNNKKTEKLCG